MLTPGTYGAVVSICTLRDRSHAIMFSRTVVGAAVRVPLKILYSMSYSWFFVQYNCGNNSISGVKSLGEPPDR